MTDDELRARLAALEAENARLRERLSASPGAVAPTAPVAVARERRHLGRSVHVDHREPVRVLVALAHQHAVPADEHPTFPPPLVGCAHVPCVADAPAACQTAPAGCSARGCDAGPAGTRAAVPA
ncbi:hypothetical protein, partial [Cellulomonas uda]|uniref:hypothetical protein n=1 Tax=Cellulomonas uda TaxID=1714 RepID=UPI001144B651